MQDLVHGTAVHSPHNRAEFSHESMNSTAHIFNTMHNTALQEVLNLLCLIFENSEKIHFVKL